MAAAPADPDDALVEARLHQALARLDRQLSEAELGQVREAIASRIASGRALRATPLANHDEPAPGFIPTPPRAAGAIGR